MKKFIYAMIVMFYITTLNAQTPALKWAKKIGGTAWDSGSGIAIDGTGNVYVVGQFFGTADFDPGPGVQNLTSAGDYEAFVCKLDATGAFVWAVALGGTSADAGKLIALDAAGNVYCTGVFQGTADFDPGAGTHTLTVSGPSDNFICKLTKDGDFVWARQTDVDELESMAVDPAGNCYFTGGFYLTVDFDPGAGVFNLTSSGQDDSFISKLDASGNFVWAKKTGSTGGDHGQSIATDATGNVYSIGNYENTVDFDPGTGASNLISEGGWDIYVQKLNTSGDFVWAKSMGGQGWDEGRSISVDPSSGSSIYIGGGFEAICDFDPGPGVTTFTSNGGYDIYISRLNGSGDLVWAKGMGGTGYDMAYCVSSGSNNKVYAVGTFTGTVDFDPGTAVNSLSVNPYFLVGLDNTGSFDLATSMPGLYSSMRLVAADGNGNLCITGSFNNTVDFDPGPGMSLLTAVAADDAFILKMGVGVVTNLEQLTSTEITIAYPNPNNGEFSIRLGNAEPASIVIYDLTGAIVHCEAVSDPVSTFDISSHPDGIYFLEIRKEKEITRAKLIKQ